MPGQMLAVVGSHTVLTSFAGPKPVRPTPGTSVIGYLSAGGLPPVQGGLLVTDSSLSFRSSDGGVTISLRRVVRAQLSAAERARSSRLELAYVNRASGQSSYVFRLDDGVFETDTPGELLLQALDLEGIAVSAGAACASGSVEPSHVLVAMGITKAEARGTLRFSVGHGTDEAQIDSVLARLPDLVARARAAGEA